MSMTRWQMEKTFKEKNFNNFFWTPLGSRVTYIYNFAFKFTLRCLQPDIVDTGGNLPPASLTLVANWSSVSLTPVANLPPVSTTLAKMVENLPPVALIPVVHLDSRISKKIETVEMEYSGAGGN